MRKMKTIKLSQWIFDNQAMETRNVYLKSFWSPPATVEMLSGKEEVRSGYVGIGVKNIFSRKKFEDYQREKQLEELKAMESKFTEILKKIKKLTQMVTIGATLNNTQLEEIVRFMKASKELKSSEKFEYIKLRDKNDWNRFGVFFGETILNLNLNEITDPKDYVESFVNGYKRMIR